MNLIKAFVGHSFTPEDSEVVEKFLKFFARLEGMNSSFSWVHAEAAEPKQLTDKVMALIQDKNLFIGICTKKEFAIAPGDVSKVPLLNKQIANSENLKWKTSDWIIQEIGLAKGRNLEILLLIENGVRKPGGLQGDVEYIPFDRSAPERSFGKIVEMISALTPQSTTATLPSSPTSPPVDKVGVPSEEVWKTPSPSWQLEQYELAMFHFIYEENEDGAKKIEEAFLASPGALDLQTIAAWKAHNHFWRLTFGKGGDLKSLQALTVEFPDNPTIREFYARGLSKFDKHLEAADEYEVAAVKTNDTSKRASFFGGAAAEYARAGKSAPAAANINKLRQSLLAGEISETQFLNAILRHAEVTKNKDLLIAISERLIDLSPDDYRTRFSLAYMHSEAGNKDLSLNHYLLIPPSERDAFGWNNLGSAFQQFRLPVKSVRAYRKSEEMNETLAMANLGYAMLSVGLLAEARAICEKALARKDFHKNVAHLLVRLNDVSAEEDKTQEEVLEKSRPKIEFYRRFGRALGLAEPKQIEGAWASPECTMNVVVTNGEIEIAGNYEEADAFGLVVGMLSSHRTVRKHIEYRGTLNGCAIFADVHRSGSGGAVASLLSQSGDGKVLMYLSDDEDEINVIENPSTLYSSIFVMKRSNAVPLIAPTVTQISGT